ncbi:MAG: septum formation initiator family protein [Deltaproteobacteria bacterium]|jgi:cell division protein FtsB|nr:septum formation initiator family protein [Deltaproteobacteria bacterium]
MPPSPRRSDQDGADGAWTLHRRLLGASDALLSSKILWLGAFFALIMGFIGYLFLSEDGFARTSGLKERKISLESENLKLEEENRQLLARLERLNSDLSFLESQARKKLRLVRSDEVIYRLAEEPDLSEEDQGRDAS